MQASLNQSRHSQITCQSTRPCNRRLSICRAQSSPQDTPISISRRQLEVLVASIVSGLALSPSAQALGFQKELKKKKIAEEEYVELPATPALRYYDLALGKGQTIADGTRLTVHFDCIYKGLHVVSSRSARLLGGNRTIAEPFEFIAGQPVSGNAARRVDEGANGLFSGSGGPKPPPALSTAVIGMRVGGKRSVLVPAALGYGDEGEQEIGPGQSFELQIDVLEAQ